MTDPLALDPRLQYIFESEVLKQWAFTIRSVAMMNDALRRTDLDAFWFAMDAALGALANISKVFFPPGNRLQASAADSRCGRRSKCTTTRC